jgi:hypothetical protein
LKDKRRETVFLTRACAHTRILYRKGGKTAVNNYTKMHNIILKNLNKKTLKKFKKLLKNS